MHYLDLTCQDGSKKYFSRKADRKILLNKKSTQSFRGKSPSKTNPPGYAVQRKSNVSFKQLLVRNYTSPNYQKFNCISHTLGTPMVFYKTSQKRSVGEKHTHTMRPALASREMTIPRAKQTHSISEGNQKVGARRSRASSPALQYENRKALPG